MLRFLGAGAILLTVASSVSAGERYIEVWNPPEARGGALHAKRLHRPIHRHAGPQAVKFRARQSPAPLPKAVAKRSKAQDVLRPTEPDVTDIPRQITPEGNILRVSSRHDHVAVSR
jgi:hypothetical protein